MFTAQVLEFHRKGRINYSNRKFHESMLSRAQNLFSFIANRKSLSRESLLSRRKERQTDFYTDGKHIGQSFQQLLIINFDYDPLSQGVFVDGKRFLINRLTHYIIIIAKRGDGEFIKQLLL